MRKVNFGNDADSGIALYAEANHKEDVVRATGDAFGSRKDIVAMLYDVLESIQEDHPEFDMVYITGMLYMLFAEDNGVFSEEHNRSSKEDT